MTMCRKIDDQIRYRYKNHNLGFSLIELLVVIAIIGILSSVILSSLSTTRNKALDARSTINYRTIKQALDVYALEHGNVYPIGIYISDQPSWDNLKILLADTLGSIPNSPSVNKPYMYWGVNNGGSGVYAEISSLHNDGTVHKLTFNYSIGKCFYLDIPLIYSNEASQNDGGIHDDHLEYVVGSGCIITIN